MGYHFFLGGKDGEMDRIHEILQQHKLPYSDAKLGWGAKTSDYNDEIKQVADAGFKPVIIELTVDSDLPQNTINIDHHNDRAGEPASLLQVLKLIGIEPSRLDQLVAANDAGHIRGMEQMGASATEIQEIRRRDRAAQGITPEQEQEAQKAITQKEIIDGVTIVRMSHSKSATVTDRLYQSGKRENLLILSSDGEVNYFGPGDICQAFKDKFSGSWAGGSGLGDKQGNAFCGGYPDQAEALSFIRAQNEARAPTSIVKSGVSNAAVIKQQR